MQDILIYGYCMVMVVMFIAAIHQRDKTYDKIQELTDDASVARTMYTNMIENQRKVIENLRAEIVSKDFRIAELEADEKMRLFDEREV